MACTKDKKVRMFLAQDGKCDYCKCDMVLSFDNKFNPENLATFDHLYNRDHPLRADVSGTGEKRIFLVCKKCNGEKSKTEPNNQQAKGIEKTIQKLVPKSQWSNQQFMDRITKVLNEENEMNREMSQIDKTIKRLLNEKGKLTVQLSKKVKYRNLIIQTQEENYPQT